MAGLEFVFTVFLFLLTKVALFLWEGFTLTNLLLLFLVVMNILDSDDTDNIIRGVYGLWDKLEEGKKEKQ